MTDGLQDEQDDVGWSFTNFQETKQDKLLHQKCDKNTPLRHLTWQRGGELAGVTGNRTVVSGAADSGEVEDLGAWQLG